MTDAMKVKPVAWANAVAFTGINERATTPVWLATKQISGHHLPLYDQSAIDNAVMAGFEACRERAKEAISNKYKIMMDGSIDVLDPHNEAVDDCWNLVDTLTPPTEQAKVIQPEPPKQEAK